MIETLGSISCQTRLHRCFIVESVYSCEQPSDWSLVASNADEAGGVNGRKK